jgi:hypothetical protein
MTAKADMPEKGLAHSLYFMATEREEHARTAIAWAKGPTTDLRQLAIVFDWCYPLLGSADKQALITKIQAGFSRTAKDAGLATINARVLAAYALAGDVEGIEDSIIKPIAGDWWQTHVLARLAQGQTPFAATDHLALFEMLHAIRDNSGVDLRETAARHFTTLPAFHILSHYPAPFPGPENEYRIPLMKQHSEPDLRDAVRTRAAGLAMVAFDNNAQEMQFVQGWLIQDRYLMRGTYGMPYEYLWANPYQPGLSYHYLPNVLHDRATGRLLIRSTWEDDAVWFFQNGATRQMFQNGQIQVLGAALMKDSVVMGNTTLLPQAQSENFPIKTEDAAGRVYVVGLKPQARYDLEVEDEELREVETDRGGVLELTFPPKREARVLLKASV